MSFVLLYMVEDSTHCNVYLLLNIIRKILLLFLENNLRNYLPERTSGTTNLACSR